MIVLDDVCVSYGDRRVVDRVRLTVAAGEFVGLLGPNGAGKTTLLRALCGLVAPSSGLVTVAGLDPRRQRVAMAKHLGFVPQDLAFYAPLTARQNLAFFGRLQGLWGASLDRAVSRVLELVQLSGRADDRAQTYSGGMKRRLNVAIGLLHEPSVLVLDEPTVGVDAQSRSALLDCFEAVGRSGAAVLYTTHLMDEAERLCSRVAIMDGGRVIAAGTPSDLVGRFGAGVLRVRFDRSPPASLAADLVELELVKEATGAGCQLDLAVHRPEPVLAALAERATAAHLRIESLELPEPTLEGVFLRLTGRRLRDERGPVE